MKKILLISFVFLSVLACKSDKKEDPKQEIETTVYYLIRHAEKDRSTATSDPELTEKGIERAKKWAEIFKKIPLDQIYSTDYKRTLQTAEFTAKNKELKILSYDPKNLFDEQFQASTKGKTVLIVGHSNTTPAFVNTILGEQKYPQIKDLDNGKLFIVTLTDKETNVLIEDHN